MVIELGPDLESALIASARDLGVAPEALALDALRKRFLPPADRLEPRDDWERLVRSAASDCGVVPPDWALSSEGLYD